MNKKVISFLFLISLVFISGCGEKETTDDMQKSIFGENNNKQGSETIDKTSADLTEKDSAEVEKENSNKEEIKELLNLLIKLEAKDIDFSEDLLEKDDEKKEEAYFAEDLSMYEDFSRPGVFTFDLKAADKDLEVDEAKLYVYSINAQMVKKSYKVRRDGGSETYYLENLAELNRIIENYENLDELENLFSGYTDESYEAMGKIVNFPPVNAAPISPLNPEIIEFENGKGIRFTVGGYLQEGSSIEEPEYIFQGITNDKKHHIVFRYKGLKLQELEKLFDEMTEDDMSAEEMNDMFEKSLEIYENAKGEEFEPSLSKLDEFVESIEIGKE